MDFAHIDGRINIEIDGEDHNTRDRQKHDRARDEFLRALGWKVIRIRV